MPLATVNLHLNRLEGAGLIRTEMISAATWTATDVRPRCRYRRPTSAGQSFRAGEIAHGGEHADRGICRSSALHRPAGCWGWRERSLRMDDPITFYEPRRYEAQLVWFAQGYVEYKFPYRSRNSRSPDHLHLSLELCSEAVPHHKEWPSDIFVEMNGIEIGTWTSPADFGGEPGRYTPTWWKEHNTQYGLLKTWRVD